MDTILQAVAGALALAITAVAGIVTPALVSWLREKILASQLARMNAAAETIVAEVAAQAGDALQASLDAQVERLKARLPDTVASLGASDGAIAGLLAKAWSRHQTAPVLGTTLQQGATALDAARGSAREGR